MALPSLEVVRDPEKIKEILAQILRERQFADLHKTTESGNSGFFSRVTEYLSSSEPLKKTLQYLERLIGPVVAWVDRTIDYLAREGILYIVFAVILSAFLIYLLLHIYRTLNRNLVSHKERWEAVAPSPSPQHPEELEIYAGRLGEEKDFRGAIRRLYVAFLLLLEKKNLLAYDPAKTNRELEMALAQHTPSELSSCMRKMSAIYEEKCYALRECTAVDWENFQRMYLKCKSRAL